MALADQKDQARALEIRDYCRGMAMQQFGFITSKMQTEAHTRLEGLLGATLKPAHVLLVEVTPGQNLHKHQNPPQPIKLHRQACLSRLPGHADFVFALSQESQPFRTQSAFILNLVAYRHKELLDLFHGMSHESISLTRWSKDFNEDMQVHIEVRILWITSFAQFLLLKRTENEQ